MELSKKSKICMGVLFAAALFLVYFGWKQTGEMGGLLIMIAGMALLLGALAVYNRPYREQKKKK